MTPSAMIKVGWTVFVDWLERMVMCNKLIAAYCRTDYIIDAADGTIVLRIDEPSIELAQMFEGLGVKNAAFITAWNPYSRLTSTADNEAANCRLRSELESVSCAVFDGRGQGQSGDWPAEASFLACGVKSEDAIRLGVKYLQNAFVWTEIDCTPRLVSLSAHGLPVILRSEKGQLDDDPWLG